MFLVRSSLEMFVHCSENAWKSVPFPSSVTKRECTRDRETSSGPNLGRGPSEITLCQHLFEAITMLSRDKNPQQLEFSLLELGAYRATPEKHSPLMSANALVLVIEVVECVVQAQKCSTTGTEINMTRRKWANCALNSVCSLWKKSSESVIARFCTCFLNPFLSKTHFWLHDKTCD